MQIGSNLICVVSALQPTLRRQHNRESNTKMLRREEARGEGARVRGSSKINKIKRERVNLMTKKQDNVLDELKRSVSVKNKGTFALTKPASEFSFETTLD